MWSRTKPVPLTRRRPKAVAPVLLVASRPSARLALAAGLLVNPKLMRPPVLWSPALAPTLALRLPRPYQPLSALDRPSPPHPPGVWAGKARPRGLARE